MKNDNTSKDKSSSPLRDTTVTNEHKDMPVKTRATDHLKNTAAAEGLNQARTGNNEPSAGKTEPGDE